MTCSCHPAARLWSGTPGRCDRCGHRTDRLTDAELDEIDEQLGPSRQLTALVAEVRERRGAERADRREPMSDVKYDAELCEQLEREAREGAIPRTTRLAMADQLAAARAEIERLTTERDNARWADETRKKAAAVIIAERDAMRPVVDAADRYRARPARPVNHLNLIAAVDAYRAARDKAGR